jgi:drug/metabolite transporter (DMT)-like permease
MPEDRKGHSHPRVSQETRVAILVLVVVNALWGLSFPILKSLNQQMEHGFQLEGSQVSNSLHVAFTAGMIGIRFAIAFLTLCLFCPRLVRGATRTEWRVGVLVGLFFYFGLVLQVMGLATIPASRSGFLTSLTAVFTPLFSAVLFRKIPSRNVAIGVVIALTGVSILTGLVVCESQRFGIASDAVSRWTMGDTLTTLGSVMFTAQLMLVDYYGKRVNSAAITPGMFLVVTVVAGLTFLALHRVALLDLDRVGLDPFTVWRDLFFGPIFFGLLVFLALFCSVLAFLGMNKYQPNISAVQASLIYSSEPVFASFWALFLPGLLGAVASRFGYDNEILSLPLILGGALILFANVVALWPRPD